VRRGADAGRRPRPRVDGHGDTPWTAIGGGRESVAARQADVHEYDVGVLIRRLGARTRVSGVVEMPAPDVPLVRACCRVWRSFAQIGQPGDAVPSRPGDAPLGKVTHAYLSGRGQTIQRARDVIRTRYDPHRSVICTQPYWATGKVGPVTGIRRGTGARGAPDGRADALGRQVCARASYARYSLGLRPRLFLNAALRAKALEKPTRVAAAPIVVPGSRSRSAARSSRCSRR
jgi:hypothetical protein